MKRRSPVLAVLLSLICMGLGALYLSRARLALLLQLSPMLAVAALFTGLYLLHSP